MPDDVITPAAESSPAPVLEVPTDSADYAEWRQTGKTPAAAPKVESRPKRREAPASSPASPAAAVEDGAETNTETSGSEPGIRQDRKRGAETRLNELLDDLRKAGLSPSELKTFKREAQQQQQQPKTPEKTAQPAEAPQRPKLEEFDSWEKYEAARDTYNESVAEFKAQQAVEKFQQTQRAQAMTAKLETALQAAKARYGESADSTIMHTAQAVMTDQAIHPMVKAIFQNSPVALDLLHEMGTHEGFQRWVEEARVNPGAAMRKAVLVENLIMQERGAGAPEGAAPAHARERDESGKFAPTAPQSTPPARKTTQAPPPPREAGGRNGAAPDEVASAADAGDFARFRNAANRRDMARRKGM